jgi:hypothetical protein
LDHATEYYSELFRPALEFNIHINDNIWDGAAMLSEADNEQLCKPFFESEIWNALSQMEKKNKAAGPDSIPVEFYQACWLIIKKDIIQLFDDFHQGRVDISRINYGIITLLPKISDAARIQQYRPICLLNCLYKLITKTLTLRIEPYAERLIHNAQSAFMKGRNIMSGVFSLHEILHETKLRKECGIVLKLDFEKAYDKVNWTLLFTCLKLEVLVKFGVNGLNKLWQGGLSVLK